MRSQRWELAVCLAAIFIAGGACKRAEPEQAIKPAPDSAPMSKSDRETLNRGNIYFGSTRGDNTGKLVAALTKENIKFEATIQGGITAYFYLPKSAYKECMKRYSKLLLSPSER